MPRTLTIILLVIPALALPAVIAGASLYASKAAIGTPGGELVPHALQRRPTRLPEDASRDAAVAPSLLDGTASSHLSRRHDNETLADALFAQRPHQPLERRVASLKRRFRQRGQRLAFVRQPLKRTPAAGTANDTLAGPKPRSVP